MLSKAIFLLVTLLLIFSAVQAEEAVTGLYEAEVPVEDQGAEQRQQALQEALKEVLNKVAEAQNIPVGQLRTDTALQRAERYVQQYRYTEGGLWVLFDPRAVDALLEQPAGTGLAGRPETLLLKVTGVRSLPDYAQVMHYLNSLKMLSNAQPRIGTPDAVLFELRSRNGRERVVQTMLHDRFLRRSEEDGPILSFHYTP